MPSARHYWSDADLTKDAKYWRERESRARFAASIGAGWIKEQCLRDANAHKMRAEASENVLYRRKHRDEETDEARTRSAHG